MAIQIEDNLESLKKKAAKWDALEREIAKFYCNREGEYDEENQRKKAT